ncbi:MAG: hypothetical protein F6K56_09615 [Moorea sp. SIO3G5]|nr:hypothetical protein [Moorena sp. SIO3G5]
MANLITGQTHHYGLGEAVPPKGVPPMSNCRGFRHSRFASRHGLKHLKQGKLLWQPANFTFGNWYSYPALDLLNQ